MSQFCSFLLVREPGEPFVFYEMNADGVKGKIYINPFIGPGAVFGIQSKKIGDSAWRAAKSAFRNGELVECGHPESVEKETYINLVNKAVAALDGSAFDKVVTSRRAVYQVPIDPLRWFKELDKTYPTSTIIWLFLPGVSSWMAATPETLLKSEGMTLETMSLAGTRPVHSSSPWGEKEIEEQQIVTQEIESNLRTLGVRNIEIGSVSTKQAGPVEHLCTRITGNMPFDSDARDVARVLHPTPAVCGRSRAKALNFLEQNEGYERGLYAGFVGWQENNRSTFYVHLRCMQIFQKHVALYAGGGITSKSNPEDEWLETERKISTLKNIIESQA